MMTRNEMIAQARKVTATINVESYIDLVEQINRERKDSAGLTCEELRLLKNKAWLEYEREKDTAEKMRLQNWWRACAQAYEDAYRQEILGEKTAAV